MFYIFYNNCKAESRFRSFQPLAYITVYAKQIKSRRRQTNAIIHIQSLSSFRKIRLFHKILCRQCFSKKYKKAYNKQEGESLPVFLIFKIQKILWA